MNPRLAINVAAVSCEISLLPSVLCVVLLGPTTSHMRRSHFLKRCPFFVFKRTFLPLLACRWKVSRNPCSVRARESSESAGCLMGRLPRESRSTSRNFALPPHLTHALTRSSQLHQNFCQPKPVLFKTFPMFSSTNWRDAGPTAKTSKMP